MTFGLTLGNRYVAASVIYLGLALLLGGSAQLDLQQVRATDEEGCSYTVMVNQEGDMVPVTYDGCPEGEQCCGGECISGDDLCCEDGTLGDADTCVCLCCEDCGEDSQTTIECE